VSGAVRHISIAVALVVATVRPAHADLAGSLYDDVRDVVEELIQTEVTTSVVTSIEQRSPALAFYMHGTLERLASPYWGSLSRVMKDDLTIVVADFVYWHVSTGGGDGDIITSAKRFFGCALHTDDTSEGCTRLMAAVGKQHRPLLEVECRRAKPAADRRVACDIGLAMLSALERRGEVRHHVVDALADIVLGELDDRALAERLRDVLTKWMDLPKDLPTPLLEALGNPDLTAQLEEHAVDTLCKDPNTLADLFHDPTASRAWICFAVTHPALPDALAATIKISDGGHTLEQRVEYWVIQAALKDFDADRATDDSAFRLLADAAFDLRCPAGEKRDAWPCKGARLGPGATVTIAWLGREISGTVDKGGQVGTKPNREMAVWLLRFRKAMRRIDELRALVPPTLAPYLFYAGSTPPASKSVLRSMSRMARLVTELRARWYLWAQSDKSSIDDLDVAELLQVAREALGSANPNLAFLDKHASGGASSIDIGDWMRMVMRGDYRALAMESMRSALGVRLSDQNHPKEKFFLTLAAYLLDSNEATGDAVARSAFKAAAKDLLLSQKKQGVPYSGNRLALRPLPRLSIRLSFNDTYAVTDGDSRRNVVSVDWPTAMFAFNDYMGIEISLLDGIAPLAEMALRPAGTYHGYPYVALDLLRPRFGGWICVPQFSRRLTLSSGFGARFLDVQRESMPMEPLVARYGARASLTFDAGIQFVF
jgi:hypothetical protein